MYGSGLDLSSVFPRLSRVQASLSIGALALLSIPVGRLSDGVDWRGIVAWIPAALAGLLLAFPEPRPAFGPQGPRLVPARDET